MQFYELLLVAVGLAMDAFAVSITKGLEMKKIRFRDAAYVGIWFGFFQALMPLIGYFLGSSFSRQIEAVDHWVAFAILALIGINMIREAVKEAAEGKKADTPRTQEQESTADLGFRTMLLLAIATSIDALAVGITFAILEVRILQATLFIGVVTFVISCAGVYVGHLFGTKFKKSAALLGGVILILIGVKILLDHLGIL